MAKKRSNYVACKDGKVKPWSRPLSRTWTKLLFFLRVRRLPNVHYTRSAFSTIPSGVKRKRSLGIYKRKKGCKYLSSAGTPQAQGPWTNYKSVLLSSVMKLISLPNVLLFIFVNNDDNNKNNKREEKTKYLSATDRKFCSLPISKFLHYILLINKGKHG